MGTIRGKVLNPVDVRVWTDYLQNPILIPAENPDRRFLIPDHPSGVFTVTIMANGFRPFTIDRVVIEDGREKDIGDITLILDIPHYIGTIRGRVIPNVRTNIFTEKASTASTSDGSYCFEEHEVGDFTVRAVAVGYEFESPQKVKVCRQTTTAFNIPMKILDVSREAMDLKLIAEIQEMLWGANLKFCKDKSDFNRWELYWSVDTLTDLRRILDGTKNCDVGSDVSLDFCVRFENGLYNWKLNRHIPTQDDGRTMYWKLESKTIM